MEAKATPGPWRVLDPEQLGREIYAGNILIAITFYMGLSYQEGGANARLIAAAPDLLAALERLIIWRQTETPFELLEQAQQAIAKAKGD